MAASKQTWKQTVDAKLADLAARVAVLERLAVLDTVEDMGGYVTNAKVRETRREFRKLVDKFKRE